MYEFSDFIILSMYLIDRKIVCRIDICLFMFFIINIIGNKYVLFFFNCDIIYIVYR